jgi:hypothetical protein
MVLPAVEAQPSAQISRLGLLSILSPAVGESTAESFPQGLRDIGYIEGKNIRIESPWADGHRYKPAQNIEVLPSRLPRSGMVLSPKFS